MTPKITQLLKEDSVKKMDKRAELILTSFINEPNLPFRLMEHLPLMCASAFTDSHIAKNVKIKRKKCTQLTVGVLVPTGKKCRRNN